MACLSLILLATIVCDIYTWILIVNMENKRIVCKSLSDESKKADCYDGAHLAYVKFISFYGTSSCVLLLLVAVILIISNFVLIRYINKGKLTKDASAQKKLLTQMSVLFSVFFGLRAVY
jgi:hypothetical protein